MLAPSLPDRLRTRNISLARTFYHVIRNFNSLKIFTGNCLWWLVEKSWEIVELINMYNYWATDARKLFTRHLKFIYLYLWSLTQYLKVCDLFVLCNYMKNLTGTNKLVVPRKNTTSFGFNSTFFPVPKCTELSSNTRISFPS